VIGSDAVSLTGGTATFANKTVGSWAVSGSGFALDGADAGNYELGAVTASANASITPLGITGSFTAEDKVYDGNTAAGVLTRSVHGHVAGDDVSLVGGTATFGDKNVGTGKTVTLSGAGLAGVHAGNYTLLEVATTMASITARDLAVTATGVNKVYDGNTDATVTGRSLNGAIAGDDVSLSGGTAAFDTKHVGTDKEVTLTGATLDGDDAGNYTLTSVSTTTADITPLGITGSFTADDKVYDGTTAATVDTRSLRGELDLVAQPDLAGVRCPVQRHQLRQPQVIEHKKCPWLGTVGIDHRNADAGPILQGSEDDRVVRFQETLARFCGAKDFLKLRVGTQCRADPLRVIQQCAVFNRSQVQGLAADLPAQDRPLEFQQRTAQANQRQQQADAQRQPSMHTKPPPTHGSYQR
jgi:hypothetical protein